MDNFRSYSIVDPEPTPTTKQLLRRWMKEALTILVVVGMMITFGLTVFAVFGPMFYITVGTWWMIIPIFLLVVFVVTAFTCPDQLIVAAQEWYERTRLARWLADK